ncbi:MAG: cysteine--tRNA ligase [Firmicutes bacterium]|nr:cysteine--tRNA ligase [Bacillota bacterium]
MERMKLYNTLSRQKENFEPLDGKTAKIYSCGPTVYSSPSIGNMRAYIFTDILKKTLEMMGFEILDVMNITDVGHLQSDADDGEDKMELSAKKHSLTAGEIAKIYTDEFFNFCEKLNIRESKIIAPATKFVDKMIDHIKGLEAKGLTYATSDGLYFDSSKFENYYALRLGLKDKKQNIKDEGGKRINLGEKRNANDFCLWRKTPPAALQKWDSQWGIGMPGWHIECSAISRACLGDTIDIHTGGVDHIPIHHTNEIAQTESLTGKQYSRFWLHNEFVMINGGKMSKSLGNVYTVNDLVKQGLYKDLSLMGFRYMVLQSHYRTIMNFTWDALNSATVAYMNLVKALSKHKYHDIEKSRGQKIKLADLKESFLNFLKDDLNTPKALAFVWELVKHEPHKDIYQLVLEFDSVLSLGLEDAVNDYGEPIVPDHILNEVKMLARQRLEAKGQKDWALADSLRTVINDLLKPYIHEIVDVNTEEKYEIRRI